MSILNNSKSVFAPDPKSNGYIPIDQRTVKDFNQQRPGGEREHVCYAPFNSMRFGLKGRVVACCHNSKEAYGEYPKQSIKQIWNSQQAKTLRNHICNDDLSFGCQVCRIDFESKNFNSIRTYMYDHFPVNPEYPTMMDFLLENTCNLECGMCNGVFSSAIRVNREGMPRKDEHYDERFVDELKEFIPHLTDARFTGGEPFLIKRYYEIWDLISSMNPTCNITVQTNGNVLTPRVKKTLERGRFGINISIESLEKDNYASIMKNGNLDSALGNIRWFSNYCKDKKTLLGITICPLRQNWHEIPAMVRFCNEVGALMWFSVVYAPSSHGIWAMSYDELQEVHKVLIKAELPTGNDLEVQNHRYFEGLIDSIVQWRDAAKKRQSGQNGDRMSKDELKQKLLDRYVLYLETETQSTVERDGQQRINQFSEKLSRVMLRLPEESLPADCWGFADEIFSDNLVMEVYESESEDRIYEDLKVFVS